MSISNMLAPAGTDMAWLDLGEKPKLLHDGNSHSSLFRPIMAPQHVGTEYYIARLPGLWGGLWSRTSTHGHQRIQRRSPPVRERRLLVSAIN